MTQVVSAIYENGVLRPLEKLDLHEHEQVEIVIRAQAQPKADTQECQRPFGLCAGEFTVPDDFDAPLPDEILQAFEGP